MSTYPKCGKCEIIYDPTCPCQKPPLDERIAQIKSKHPELATHTQTLTKARKWLRIALRARKRHS